jgi:adenosylcobinamide-phosphate synthase
VGPELALAALAVEAAVGYPPILHRWVPHPVTWLGAMIAGLEGKLNIPQADDIDKRLLGIATLVVITALAGGVGWLLQALLSPLAWGLFPLALLASLGLAQRSLYDHVRAVRRALEADDLPGARAAVGLIVGRDTADLDASGVVAAALESLAESFNDGVVAPAFWLAFLGLPGLYAYKAVNTADSLIGHREPRWRAFGWASARTDDLMNLAPARIAGLLIVVAGGRGLDVMLRDAPRHASPNAGWPEAAMAGVLGRRLGGPASYDGVLTARPTFGDGPPPDAADLARGLRVYLIACGLLWALVALGAVAWPR